MTETPIKILHIEDNLADAELIKVEMEKSFLEVELCHVTTKDDFVQHLKENQYDLILSDYNIPGFEEVESLQIVREYDKIVPVIYASGAIGEEKAIELLKSGVTDYILKDNLEKIPLAIKRAVDEVQEQKNKLLVEEKLKENEVFKTGILDSLSSHIAVLNGDGVILETNEAWKRFARENERNVLGNVSEGANYINELAKYIKKNDEIKLIYNGIVKIIERKAEYFYHDYPCPSPTEERWYTLRVTPIGDDGGVVLSYSNITERVKAEEETKKAKEKLEVIADNIGEIVYKLTLNGNNESHIDFISNNVIDVLGFTTEDYIKGNPKLVKSMKPERYEQAVEFNKMVRALSKSDSYYFEYEWFHPVKNEWRWMNETTIPEVVDGKVVGQFGTVQDITKRKKAEQLLLERKERLKDAQRIAKLGNWELDLRTNELHWSDEIFRIFGMDPEKFGATYETFLSTIHPLDRDRVNNAYMDHIKHKKPYSIQHRIRLDDGTVKHVQEECYSEFDEEGRAVISRGTVQDITQRVKAEKELQKERQRLDYIIQGTNLATWEWNVQTGESILNDRWAEMLGYKLDELIPVSIKTWESFVHPEDKEKSKKAAEKHFKGETEFYEVETRMKHKNGHWVWVHDKGKVASWSKDGKPLWMYGTHQDISERKTIEEKIRMSEEQYRGLFNKMHEGLLFSSPEGIIKIVNPRFCEMLGYTEKELIGKNGYEFLLEDAFQEQVKDKVKERERGESDRYEVEFVKKDGGRLWAKISASPHYNSKGEFEGVMSIVSDITKLIQAEKEKYFAIIQAEETERQRISHDLHDGLGQTIAAANMCINTLESYAESQLDEESYSIFKTGKKLINDATKETRLVSHNIMPRSLKQFGLHQTVDEMLGNYQKINESIKFALDSNLEAMRFDDKIELTLFRVIQELLNNALKHSKASEIKVRLILKDKKLRVEVTDDGVGFDVKKIGESKDAGIGLYSLSHRINMIGGKSTIKSEESKGTKVKINLNLP